MYIKISFTIICTCKFLIQELLLCIKKQLSSFYRDKYILEENQKIQFFTNKSIKLSYNILLHP